MLFIYEVVFQGLFNEQDFFIVKDVSRKVHFVQIEGATAWEGSSNAHYVVYYFDVTNVKGMVVASGDLYYVESNALRFVQPSTYPLCYRSSSFMSKEVRPTVKVIGRVGM